MPYVCIKRFYVSGLVLKSHTSGLHVESITLAPGRENAVYVPSAVLHKVIDLAVAHVDGNNVNADTAIYTIHPNYKRHVIPTRHHVPMDLIKLRDFMSRNNISNKDFGIAMGGTTQPNFGYDRAYGKCRITQAQYEMLLKTWPDINTCLNEE